MKISEALKKTGLTTIPLEFYDIDFSYFQGDLSKCNNPFFKAQIEAIKKIENQSVIDFITLSTLHTSENAFTLNNLQVFPIPEFIEISHLYANTAVENVDTFRLFPETVELSFVRNHENLALKYFEKSHSVARIEALKKWLSVSTLFLDECQKLFDQRKAYEIEERELIAALEHPQLFNDVLTKYYQYNKSNRDLQYWSSLAIALISKKPELALESQFNNHNSINVLIACSQASVEALRVILSNPKISDWHKNQCLETHPELIQEYLKNYNEYTPSSSLVLKHGTAEDIKYLLENNENPNISDYGPILANPDLYELAFTKDNTFDSDCLRNIAIDIGASTDHPIAPYLLNTANTKLCMHLIEISAQWAVYLVKHPDPVIQLECSQRSKKAKALLEA
ncbi:hypothetical protein OFK41_07815 [Acinetobacter baumannii]|uniref:hypothetical protein n=1 Tax=Acinetobacter baumannii TaxID=470 RepID=UPI00224F5C3F|nr:hypothetical protein [Acinetobacter baumannii]MCX3034113.1 hypothetical protein [Acinetobacter baumannii]